MKNWTKWMGLIVFSLLITLNPLTTAHAAEGTVYEKFEKTPESEPSTENLQVESNQVSIIPYVIKFTGSFLLIIALLLIIQKYVLKKKRILQGGGPFHSLAGHSLGNNRSMQMLMIGDTLYILGVGENINLIRTIAPGEEQTKLLEAVAESETPSDTALKWGQHLKKTSQEKWNELFIQHLKESNKDKDQL